MKALAANGSSATPTMAARRNGCVMCQIPSVGKVGRARGSVQSSQSRSLRAIRDQLQEDDRQPHSYVSKYFPRPGKQIHADSMHDVDAILKMRCSRCETDVEADSSRTACPACGALLELAAPRPDMRGDELRRIFAKRRGAIGGNDVITFPEGNTPLIHAGRASHWAGCPTLRVKHEGLNPTGSFKDRGMTVGIT